MRVLISGAGGFVGGHLAVAMARNGHDVVALVRRTRSAILETQKHIRIEQADLAQRRTLSRRVRSMPSFTAPPPSRARSRTKPS